MKKTFLLIGTLGCLHQAHAQFEMNLGAGFAVSAQKKQHFLTLRSNAYSQKTDTSYYTYLVSGGGFGIFLYPKYHVVEVVNHSLSVGAPIMLGFSGSANTQTGGSFSYLYDMNLSLDINGGRLNKKRGDSKEKLFGYFVGVGLGIINTSSLSYELNSRAPDKNRNYHVISNGESIDDHISGKNAGVFIHAGGTLPLMFNRESGANMGLRLFVKPGLGQKAPTYFGMNAFLSLGKYAENTYSSRSKSKTKPRTGSSRRR